MGFDVYGLSPKSEKGKYFRNSVWWWKPLARFILENCDVQEEEAEDWGTNDGQEVSALTADHIADRLDMLLKSGAVKEYELEREKRINSLPDVECNFCDGTGYRNDLNMGEICNRCKGKGIARPWETIYPFSEDNVKGFMEFCRESGGFEIW
jgi:hypothetical protein